MIYSSIKSRVWINWKDDSHLYNGYEKEKKKRSLENFRT